MIINLPYIPQGDKDKIKSLVDELVLLKSEYKEKSGKDYGSAPPKEKKEIGRASC